MRRRSLPKDLEVVDIRKIDGEHRKIGSAYDRIGQVDLIDDGFKYTVSLAFNYHREQEAERSERRLFTLRCLQ